MKIINRFKVSSRLYSVMIFALLAIIIVVTYSLNTTNRVGELINTINNHPLIVSNTAADTQEIVLEILGNYQEAFIENNPSKQAYYEKNIENLAAELDSNMETIVKLILGEEGQKLAKETRGDIDKWKKSNEGFLDDIFDSNDRETVKKYILNDQQNAVEQIQLQLNDIQNYAGGKADNLAKDAELIQKKARDSIILMGTLLTLILCLLTLLIIKDILASLSLLKKTMAKSIEKNKFIKVEQLSMDEIGDVASHYNILIEKLKVQFDIRNGLNELSNIISGDLDMKTFSSKTISFLSDYMDSGNGVLYIYKEETETLDLIASYAFTERQKLMNHLKLGESLVGQVAVERKPILLKNVNRNEGLINSGLISEAPLNIVGIPLVFENKLCGVIELSSFELFDTMKMEYLNAASEIVAASIYSAMQNEKIHLLLDKTTEANTRLEIQKQEVINKSEELAKNNEQLSELFETSRRQAEYLQVQQEELRQNNEELEEQTRALQDSEGKLQLQQEELRVTNEELETHANELEEQKLELNEKNRALAKTQIEMAQKAEALEKANNYKSEFLANMSHELRTPLNSILVLSQLLAGKESDKPLSDKEKSFASTIYSSGKDLLTLINGVLDLAKVEAGKLQVHNEKVYLKEIVEENRNMFESMTELKKLKLEFSIDDNMPSYIETDSLRLNQIIKNLISNSIKFTSEGHIDISFRNLKEEEASVIEGQAKDYIAIEVKDTGIGIPDDKLDEVFEAFRQSDGTTSRQYGGTGLGLTISLELAKILGGNIVLESELNKGSIFSLIIPKFLKTEKLETTVINAMEIISNYDKATDSGVCKSDIEDVIEDFEENEKRMLIIEDDPTFARILSDLSKEKGFVVTNAYTGKEGIEKVKLNKPTGIILDIGLPDMDGLILAKMLSDDESTKNIPIHVISGSEEISEGTGFADMPQSIIGFLKKPVDIKSIYKTLSKIESVDSRGPKQILVVGSCADEDFNKFTQLGQVKIDRVLTAGKAFAQLEEQIYGCIILDTRLPDATGVDFMTKLRKDMGVYTPIIIYTDEDINEDEIDDINKFAETIILKSEKSKDRLVDEASLFLHDIERSFTDRRPVKNVISNDLNSLAGVRVLLADDDNRNVFALMHLLEKNGMTVVAAKDGYDAVGKFKENDFEVILMDIMMPKMDGYEAIREIRQSIKGKNIPIIALTAKAMTDDRDKCISAGANDYLMKPVDSVRLISMIKVWMS